MYGMRNGDGRPAERNVKKSAANWTVALLLPMSLVACPGSLADPGEFETAGGSGGGSGSGGSSSGSGAGGSSGAASNCDAPTILTMYCGISGCHAGLNPQGMLDLTLANQGNLSTLTSSDDYPGMKIVDPGNPMMSVLYEKLQANAVGSNGYTQMPPGGFIPANQATANIACIESWINSYTPSPSGGDAGAGGGSSSGGGAGLGSSSSGGAGLGSSSSGGSGGADAGPSVTFTSLYTSIIMPVCLPCHSTQGGQTTGKLNMSTQGLAYTDLTNTTATLGAACTGKGMLVVAGDHTTSLLWEKLQPTPPCGSQMPKTGTLTAAQIAEFAAWIDDGAKNN